MSQTTVFIGCDPGESGGIAIILPIGEVSFIRWDKMTTREAFKDLMFINVLGLYSHALLEKVHAMPGQGVTSTFKFGQSYGKLETLLVCAGIPFDRVTPRQWQKEMGCLSGGDKNVTKKRAQELFPDVKIIHRNADAFLLAELCRRRHQLPSDGRTNKHVTPVDVEGGAVPSPDTADEEDFSRSMGALR